MLQEIIEYLDTLKNAATAYCDLHRPLRANAFNDISDISLRRKVIYFSDKLARLGARASFQPLLIAVRLKSDDGGQCYLETVQLCEKYDFRIFQWMRRQPRSGQSQLFRLGYDYFHHSNHQALRTGIIQTLLSYCNETQFKDGFREGGDWYHWNGLRYFLYEYEQHLADQAGKPVKMPWEVLVRSKKEDTIEHILPQTPTDEYWMQRFTSEDHERWMHDFGNFNSYV